ncbi:MAG: formate dehydrogenase accessory protein FdhE [Chloroflexota bacterium]
MSAATTQEWLKDLETRGRETGILPELIGFYRELWLWQNQAEEGLGTVTAADLQSAAERLPQGLPLLSFDRLTLDWSRLPERFGEATAIFARYPALFGKISRNGTAGAVKPFTPAVARKWFEGSDLGAAAKAADLSPALLESIIHATLKPYLVSHSRTAISLVDQENWRRGYCPVCGGRPDLAFLSAANGSRWLVCSRCDAEWLFQRLECPYCGTTDQSALAYLPDETGRYRLYVCENCRRYLKTIDLRQAGTGVVLPLERLFTLDLDRQARDSGYHL